MIDRFVQGYACAVATIVQGHGADTEAIEALEACGLTSVEALVANGVSEYDIEILTPLVKAIEAKRQAKAEGNTPAEPIPTDVPNSFRRE